MDGSSNNDDSRAGLLLEDPHEKVCSYALPVDFPAFNNEVEYESVIVGLRLARRLGARHIWVNRDS